MRRAPALHRARSSSACPASARLAPLAGAHHERLDGSGYPHGLDGGALTVPMRILAVADVYEALTSARPYRPAMSSARRSKVHPARRAAPARRERVQALESVLSAEPRDLRAGRAESVLEPETAGDERR